MPNYIDDHREKRVQFAFNVKQSKLDWTTIVFSDESDLFPDKQGKCHYRKYKGENLDIDYGPEFRWDPRKIKVWGAISAKGVGTIVRYEGNIESTDYITILEAFLLQDFPFLKGTRTRRSKYSFQQDGAGPHRGKVVDTFFQSNHISTLPWPAKSPDLSPIENIWGFIKGELFKKNAQLNTAEETWKEIKKIWYTKVNSMISNLYSSLPKRIETVIALNGRSIS